MRADHAALALVLTMQSGHATAQSTAQTPSPVVPPVIACTSLANLRIVLRSVNDDAAAALPIITDPKSDLGCHALDRSAVTGLADHVALNGRAYDCLALQGTSVCRWVKAGAVRLSAGAPPEKTPIAEPGRR